MTAAKGLSVPASVELADRSEAQEGAAGPLPDRWASVIPETEGEWGGEVLVHWGCEALCWRLHWRLADMF